MKIINDSPLKKDVNDGSNDLHLETRSKTGEDIKDEQMPVDADNQADILKKIERKIISTQKDGCGIEFILDGRDVFCGADFEYKGQVKVVLCSCCLDKIKEIKKIFQEELK